MTTRKKAAQPGIQSARGDRGDPGEKTLSQLGSQFKVHPMQIGEVEWPLWRTSGAFVDGRKREGQAADAGNDVLYEEIGSAESGVGLAQKKVGMLDSWYRGPRSCRDLRSAAVRTAGAGADPGLYYEPLGEARREPGGDAVAGRSSTRGSAVLWEPENGGLARNAGIRGEPAVVSRLMMTMGIEAVYPKPRLSLPGEGHKVYPYLLRGVGVDRVNQVWSTDITYIRMSQGFAYLVAVMDWFSRYVPELEIVGEPGTRLLRRGAEAAPCGAQPPEIFNMDQKTVHQ